MALSPEGSLYTSTSTWWPFWASTSILWLHKARVAFEWLP
jgi:hypothetical protein